MISVAENYLLRLINLAFATSVFIHLAATLKTPPDENHIFDVSMY